MLIALVGLLMVSNFRYHSFKQIDFQGRIPFIVAVVLMLGLAVLFMQPPLVLFLGFLIYALSGPVITLVRLLKKRSRPAGE